MQNRPEFYNRIDQALDRRESLIDVIQAANKTLFGADKNPGTQSLLEALKSGIRTEEFLRDPALLKWLPLLLANNNPEMDSQMRIRKITAAIEDEFISSSRRKLRFSYAWNILAIGAVLFSILLVWIVPNFRELYADFQLILPVPTKLLFGLSDAIRLYPVVFAAGLALVFASLIGAKRILRLISLYGQETFFIGSVVAGNRDNLQAMSRFAGTLAELIEIGAPVSEALRVAASVSGRPFIVRDAMRLSQSLDSNSPTTITESKSISISPTVILALRCNSSGTPNTQLLRQLANIYRTQEKCRRGIQPQAVGAMAAFVFGCLVALTVIALFMPLISLLTSLGG